MLQEALQKVFAAKLQIQSHFSSVFPRASGKTALVVFDCFPEDLRLLEEDPTTSVSLPIANARIQFDQHMLDLTTLYEPEEKQCIVAE